METCRITVDNCIFQTSGNITFTENEDCSYVMAKSQILEKMEGFISEGILGNGMKSFLEKIKGL
ncbi:hypothetical protein A2311_02820 [candidate division WOR-1 bacterium RIFOXYB2_FULL_48_7]|uniref:Uncharacterized protein n=1 Tax=candidate division WOR-1 bacterium RIFOXYB2_FULL_48_7 TaxID=1802583 RepID=A0A1F4TMB1_UNCSA|nr:MAG: hypothetical protein A2311_02820 [candidate division WOR-1 bacterium RIFOXYB2_FULL_48_7]